MNVYIVSLLLVVLAILLYRIISSPVSPRNVFLARASLGLLGAILGAAGAFLFIAIRSKNLELSTIQDAGFEQALFIVLPSTILGLVMGAIVGRFLRKT